MLRPKNHRVTIAIGVVLALLIGGVGYIVLGDDTGGTGGGPSSGSTDPEAAAAYEFAECVRAEGVADYPDPTIESDGSIMFEGISDPSVSDEKLEAAQEACHHILDEFVPNEDGHQRSTGTSADELAAAGWEEIVPGGDCECADGSEYSFFAREASTEKVVLFLDGGGACWSAETCAPGGTNEYQTTVQTPSGEGIFDFADKRNPFADHSVVFVPYCTGDVHLGNSTAEYTSDLTVHHKGYVNGTAAVDHLAETFPDAKEIVVIGASAGSVSAPLYAGLVADRFPDAEITSIADSSGAYPDAPELNDILTDSGWGTTDALSTVTSDLRSIPGLYISAAQRHPDITFARYDHAYDAEQASKTSLAGAPADDLLALIDANETRIEDVGVNLLSYTASGDQHVVLADDGFFDETVGGTALVDWVADVVERNPVEDVHCTDCAAS